MLLAILYILSWYVVAPTISLLAMLALYQQLFMGICHCTGRLDGKVAVITGANTGMGYETALELARRGCRVYVACRAKVEGEADPTDTVKEIRRLSGNYDVHFRKLDMSLLGAVQEFAEMFQKEEDKLDILVNNAGIIGRGDTRKETREGLEVVTATNYFGPFFLIHKLIDSVKRANGRIINISSVSNIWSSMNLDDLNSEVDFPGPYQHAWVYARSKLYFAMFTKELAEREPSVAAASVSPGIVITMIARDLIGLTGINSIMAMGTYINLSFKNTWQGAQTAIHLALAPQVTSGAHYADCKVGAGYLAKVVGDRAARQKLWKKTEEVVQKAMDRITMENSYS